MSPSGIHEPQADTGRWWWQSSSCWRPDSRCKWQQSAQWRPELFRKQVSKAAGTTGRAQRLLCCACGIAWQHQSRTCGVRKTEGQALATEVTCLKSASDSTGWFRSAAVTPSPASRTPERSFCQACSTASKRHCTIWACVAETISTVFWIAHYKIANFQTIPPPHTHTHTHVNILAHCTLRDSVHQCATCQFQSTRKGTSPRTGLKRMLV